MKVDSLAIATFNVTAGNIAASTPFDVQYTATAGTSNQYVLDITQNVIISFVATYCDASADDVSFEYISNVEFGDINNTTIHGGAYHDYTNLSTGVAVGETYILTVTNGDHDDSDNMGCWIDWNYDGDFDDENETINIAYSNPYGIANITVPEGAHIGETRMRIRLLWAWEELIESCGNSAYGEVEDYSVNILSVVGIENNEIEEGKLSVTIFPNPTNGIVNIIVPQVDINRVGNLGHIEITNITGTLVKTKYLNYASTQLNLSQLNSGIYFINVSTPKGIVSKKIIIRK